MGCFISDKSHFVSLFLRMLLSTTKSAYISLFLFVYSAGCTFPGFISQLLTRYFYFSMSQWLKYMWMALLNLIPQSVTLNHEH